MSLACAACFEDKIARRFIRDNGLQGICGFCGARRHKVVSAHKLRPLFEEVVSLYRPYEPAPGSESWKGETLSECMAGWDIFNADRDKKVQNSLLDEIMGFDPHDGDLSASDDWQAKSDHWAATPLHERWRWFAEHLKGSRRFIIEEDATGEIVRPETWVPNAIREADAFRKITIHTRLFRGRLGFTTGAAPRAYRLPLPADQMGAPPTRLARAGRANPEGISHLYCAFDAETAIVETGRFPGGVVSLREFRARKFLRVADLTGNKSTLEPLATSDLATEVATRTMLHSLGSALAEPIHPEDSNLEYVPTQYLAEVIQTAGYDGICYPSALNPKGTNVVIFKPADVRVTRRAWTFEIGDAQYTIHPNPKFVISRRRRKTKLPSVQENI